MMKGDLVHLKNTFKPEPNGLKEYHFGIIAGLVPPEPKVEKRLDRDVVLWLYDPQTLLTYKDNFDAEVLFYFKHSEIETVVNQCNQLLKP
jgi:hypothetical protein